MSEKVITVLVTGSRDWNHEDMIVNALVEIEQANSNCKFRLVHGGCPTGADMLANKFATARENWSTKIYQADWKRYGRAAGPKRNREMVFDSQLDYAVVFSLNNSRGTANCLKNIREYMTHANKNIELIQYRM